MEPCVFVARPVFEEVLDSLRQHLNLLLNRREDRWLFAGIILIAADAGATSEGLLSLIILVNSIGYL